MRIAIHQAEGLTATMVNGIVDSVDAAEALISRIRRNFIAHYAERAHAVGYWKTDVHVINCNGCGASHYFRFDVNATHTPLFDAEDIAHFRAAQLNG